MSRFTKFRGATAILDLVLGAPGTGYKSTLSGSSQSLNDQLRKAHLPLRARMFVHHFRHLLVAFLVLLLHAPSSVATLRRYNFTIHSETRAPGIVFLRL